MITFIPQRKLGINSNDCNMYSNGILIGYCSFEQIERARKRDFTLCKPIASWKSTFSIKLMKEFGLK